jgi:hypothetical protein
VLPKKKSFGTNRRTNGRICCILTLATNCDCEAKSIFFSIVLKKIVVVCVCVCMGVMLHKIINAYIIGAKLFSSRKNLVTD